MSLNRVGWKFHEIKNFSWIFLKSKVKSKKYIEVDNYKWKCHYSWWYEKCFFMDLHHLIYILMVQFTFLVSVMLTMSQKKDEKLGKFRPSNINQISKNPNSQLIYYPFISFWWIPIVITFKVTNMSYVFHYAIQSTFSSKKKCWQLLDEEKVGHLVGSTSAGRWKSSICFILNIRVFKIHSFYN